MHTAEDDEIGVGVPAHLPGELVRIAGVVGELDDLVALVVMSENHEAPAELCARYGNPPIHFLIGQTDIPLGQRLPLADVLLFVLRQQRYQHGL